MVAMREYRIVLPFTLDEYRIAQLYMVANYSAKESDGEDGVEVLKNEPFENEKYKGQYTHKLYHLNSKLPSWIVALAPPKALILNEEAWNAYPYCKTTLTSPYFSKFKLEVETLHVADREGTENALNLSKSDLETLVVERIDIGQDPWDSSYGAPSPEEDPAQFKSKLTGRGPLTPGWRETCEPVMTAYKLVTVDVPYWGFGSKLEKYIAKTAQRKLFTEGNRRAFCWMDEWYNLTIDDIRKMEKDIFDKMNNERAQKKGQNSSSNNSTNGANHEVNPSFAV